MGNSKFLVHGSLWVFEVLFLVSLLTFFTIIQIWTCLDLYNIGFCDCLPWELCDLLNEQKSQSKYLVDIWCQLYKRGSRSHLWICAHSSSGILLFASVFGFKCQPCTLLVLVGIFSFHFHLDFCKYLLLPFTFDVCFMTCELIFLEIWLVIRWIGLLRSIIYLNRPIEPGWLMKWSGWKSCICKQRIIPGGSLYASKYM